MTCPCFLHADIRYDLVARTLVSSSTPASPGGGNPARTCENQVCGLPRKVHFGGKE
jgi:hypothetical protein